MSLLDVSFDPQSLSAIAQMYGMQILLTPEVQAAMRQGADLIVSAAQDNTWATFMDPTGVLADSITRIVDSPYEIIVGSPVAYAHRREFSFKGPDSLGRYFPNDPSAMYMTNAMNQQQNAVLQLIDDGAARALARMAGGE